MPPAAAGKAANGGKTAGLWLKKKTKAVKTMRFDRFSFCR